MHNAIILALLIFSLTVIGRQTAAAEKPRLMVLTDIGGDPDDQQSLIRLLLYANEFDIEGLIATASGTPGELKQAITRPDLIREIVQAFGKVRGNLAKHTEGYPEAATLLERIKPGNRQRGQDFVGQGHDTDGSRSIIDAADRDDARPLNIVIWGGQTDFAQALWRVRENRGGDGLRKFLARIRVYDIDDQDRIQPWIFENFPDLFYVLAKSSPGADKRTGAYRGMYLGGDESLTSRNWVDTHVRKDHGPLGALYPTETWTAPNLHSTLKEGDTPSWFYFLPTGLGDPAHPDWGGWGGRFKHVRAGLWRDDKDTVGDTNDARATVWRWRPAFQSDFQARMDWCIKPFDEANHPPAPVLNGEKGMGAVEVKAKPGQPVQLSAAGSSDPDDDQISYQWWIYPEASNYSRDVPIENASDPVASITPPPDAAGKTLHVILEVRDDGAPVLTRYRRAIIKVSE
ncbi:MAG: DUF1593 domain-containing protein [Pirellulales bacterium]